MSKTQIEKALGLTPSHPKAVANAKKKQIMNETDLKEAEVMRMRRLGWTFQKISDELGLGSKSTAFNIFSRVMMQHASEMKDQANTLREEQIEQIDYQMSLLLEQQQSDYGNLNIVDRIIKLQERKSKLLGLDSATKTETTVNLSMTHEQALDLIDITPNETHGPKLNELE